MNTQYRKDAYHGSCFRTEHGSRHLEELMLMRGDGHEAALVFRVQRNDVDRVRPADQVDLLYGKRLREAAECDCWRTVPG